MSEENDRQNTGLSMARAALAAAREAAKNRLPVRKRTTGSPRQSRSSRDPQKFGAAISDLIKDRGWEEEMAVGAVIGRWEQVAGSDLAAHVQPFKFEAKTLYLRADSTAWATQLRLLTPKILASLTAEVGPGVIERLEISGPAAPSWKKGPRSAPGRGPRDTYG